VRSARLRYYPGSAAEEFRDRVAVLLGCFDAGYVAAAGQHDELGSGDGGGDRLSLRGAADREKVIDLLKAAFVQGQLTKDELDTRAGHALAAWSHADLAALTADLHRHPRSG